MRVIENTILLSSGRYTYMQKNFKTRHSNKFIVTGKYTLYNTGYERARGESPSPRAHLV